MIVAGVLVLAAAAAGDALRGAGGEEAADATRPERLPGRPDARLVRAGAKDFVADGPFLRNRVVRAGREHLSAAAIAEAFPGPVDGPLDISKVAVAPEGTLVLAIYRFPADGDARGALELWRGRRLVGAFPVPPGSFGGGLAFDRDAEVVATFSHDGRLRGVFDLRGRPTAGVEASFRSGD